MDLIKEDRIVEVYRQRLSEIYDKRGKVKPVYRWLRDVKWKGRPHELYRLICCKYDEEVKPLFPPELDQSDSKIYAVYFNRLYDLYSISCPTLISGLPALMHTYCNNSNSSLHELYAQVMAGHGQNPLPEYNPYNDLDKDWSSSQKSRSWNSNKTQKKKQKKRFNCKPRKPKPKPKISVHQIEISYRSGQNVRVLSRGKYHKARIIRVNEDGTYNVEYKNPRFKKGRKGQKEVLVLRNIHSTKLKELEVDDKENNLGGNSQVSNFPPHAIHEGYTGLWQFVDSFELSPVTSEKHSRIGEQKKLSFKNGKTPIVREKDNQEEYGEDTSNINFNLSTKKQDDERWARTIADDPGQQSIMEQISERKPSKEDQSSSLWSDLEHVKKHRSKTIKEQVATLSDKSSENNQHWYDNNEIWNRAEQAPANTIFSNTHYQWKENEISRNEYGSPTIAKLQKESNSEGLLRNSVIIDKKIPQNNLGKNTKNVLYGALPKLDILESLGSGDPNSSFPIGNADLVNILEIVWDAGVEVDKELPTSFARGFAIGNSMLQKLKELKIKLAVIPERNKQRYSEHYWLVEPMCGDDAEIESGEWTLCVGLVDSIKDGRPVIGVVMKPSTGQIAWGSSNGAYIYSHVKGEVSKLVIRDKIFNGNCKVALSGKRTSWLEGVLMCFEKVEVETTSQGSVFLKLVTGEADIAYLENVDDPCLFAGYAIVYAAGGIGTFASTSNEPLYNYHESNGKKGFVCSSNSIVELWKNNVGNTNSDSGVLLSNDTQDLQCKVPQNLADELPNALWQKGEQANLSSPADCPSKLLSKPFSPGSPVSTSSLEFLSPSVKLIERESKLPSDVGNNELVNDNGSNMHLVASSHPVPAENPTMEKAYSDDVTGWSKEDNQTEEAETKKVYSTSDLDAAYEESEIISDWAEEFMKMVQAADETDGDKQMDDPWDTAMIEELSPRKDPFADDSAWKTNNSCESEIRAAWKKGSQIKIWSTSQGEWFDGIVKDITKDEEGEWLDISYKIHGGQVYRKQAQRKSPLIKPKPYEQLPDESENKLNTLDPIEFYVEIHSFPYGFTLVEAETNVFSVGSKTNSLIDLDWIVTAVNDTLVKGYSKAQIDELILKSNLPVKILFKGCLSAEQLTQKLKNPWFSLITDSGIAGRRKRKCKPDEVSIEDMGIGSKCKIYSRGQNKWFKGQVSKIVEDNEGTWLEVNWKPSKDGNLMKKQVKRNSPDIQPLSNKESTEIDKEVRQVVQWCSKQGLPISNYIKVFVEFNMGWHELQSLNVFALQRLGFKEEDFPGVMASVDKLHRAKWAVGSFVDVWSERNSDWYLGMVIDVFTDSSGEWLKVKYNNSTCEKEVQRWSTTIRCSTMVNPNHKALDWSTNAVAWWASKQAGSMRKYSELFCNEGVVGKDLLSMNYLNLELVGVSLDDIESCLKLLSDLREDSMMIKKLNLGTDCLESLVEISKDIENSCQRTVTEWRREYSSSGYAWERFAQFNDHKPIHWDTYTKTWNEAEVGEWLGNLGDAYVRYAEVFQREMVEGATLFEFTINDFQDIGIPELHCLKIMLELEKLRTGRSYLLNAWSHEEVIGWLEIHALNDSPEEIRTQKVNGDVMSMLTKEILITDLKFRKSTAQKFVEVREEQKLERCCFAIVFTEKEINKTVYELLRTGRVTTALLKKEEELITTEEQPIIDDIPPVLLRKLIEFVKIIE